MIAILSLVLATGAIPGRARADKAFSLNNQGIEAFRAEQYEQSADFFAQALTERPDSPEIRFNLGTALAAAGKLEDGVHQLDIAAEQFPNTVGSAASHYNAGTALLGSGDPQAAAEAVEQLKRAVMHDQNSQDYRYNLELAMRRMQSNQQQGQGEQQSEPQDSDQSKENEQKQEQQDRSDRQDRQEKGNPGDQRQESRVDEDRPMTPEEARRILDAMQDEEERALSLRREQMTGSMQQGDDW